MVIMMALLPAAAADFDTKKPNIDTYEHTSAFCLLILNSVGGTIMINCPKIMLNYEC